MMAQKQYVVEAIDLQGVLVRKPRRLARFTLRRLDNGSTFEVKLRSLAQVGDVITLDESQVHLGLWTP
jgi:hypothetical protein